MPSIQVKVSSNLCLRRRLAPVKCAIGAQLVPGGLLTLVLLLVSATLAYSQTPTPSSAAQAEAPADSLPRLVDLPLQEELTEILGGNLRLRLPQGTLEQRRGEVEPGAPLEDESRTNLIVAAGDERLLIRSFETFQRYTSSFEKEGRAYLNGHSSRLGKMIVEPMRLSSKLVAYAFQPENIVVNRQAIFLMGMLIAHPDSSVKEIRFFCNRPAITHAADLVTIVRRIAKSVRVGSSFVRGSGSAVKIGKNDIQLPLERSFFVTRQRGDDFIINRFALPAALGSFAGKMGIYSGPRPAFRHLETDSTVVPRKAASQLFGTPQEWYYWTEISPEGQRSVLLLESIVQHPTEPGNFLHIFASAATPEQLEILRSQAERLTTVQ